MALRMAEVPELTALERENLRLSRAVRELSILNDLARAIGASHNSQEVMQTIIARSLKAVDAEQGVITLVNRDPSHPADTLVRAMVSSARLGPFHLTDALLGWMQLNKSTLAVNEPATDTRFSGIVWDERVATLLCVPLIVKGELTGILAVYNKKARQRFDADDQRLLAIIASQSAQVIETARLYEEERALARVLHQISLAAEIQQHLLPVKLPSIPGYGLAGTSISAEIVGGDYFDVIPMRDRKWSLCLGDVSGKGIPASLLMSNVQAMIRLLARMDIPPCESIRRANELLVECTPPHKFVTFFLTVLNAVTGRLEFCNAGHNPPFHVTASGECRPLATKGAVLGMFRDFAYKGGAVDLEPGDAIVIYSDGVTEALDADEEEFGEARLLDILSERRQGSAAEIQAAIIEAVRAHAGKHPQSDDVTLVVLKREG